MTRINFIFIFLLAIGLNAQKLSDNVVTNPQIDPTSQITSDDSTNIEFESTYIKTDKKEILREEKSRLVKKADGFFDRMWYANAAKYYDLAIEQSKGKPSSRLLSRAGDSHYFNSNIKKAYKWYNLLYKNYKNEISENTLFNYVHTLKGTGRKKRAKRIINILNEKNAKELKEDDNAAIRDSLAEDSRFDLKNLEINSKYSDFSPMFYGKDKLLYVSAKDTSIMNARKYKWDNQPYLNLYTAKVDSAKNDVFGTYGFSKNINTKYHEGSACFSPDKKTIYFTRNNYGKKKKVIRDKKGINHLKLYISKEVNGEWTEAVELPFNSDSYSTGHPVVTADGKKLFFVSDMPGGYGNTDVYVVDIEEDGTFSKPQNLGMAVNSPRKEMFPFITENTLYFSSDRLAGFGGLDIYKSSFSAEGFDKAENLGVPFNSERDDFSIIIDEETETGYFASSRDGGKGRDDIYSFAPASKNLPNLNEISGYIVDIITGDSLPNATVSIYNAENVLLEEIKTDDKGVFRFNNLNSNTDYTIRTNLNGYVEETTPVATKSNEVVNLVLSISRLDELIAVENSDTLEENLPNLNEISGYILDVVAGDSLPNATVSIYNAENVLLEEIKTDDKGVFRFNNLNSNTDYTIRTNLDGYVEEITPVSTISNKVVDLIIQIEPVQEIIVVEKGIKKLKTEMIFFDFDRFNIKQDAANKLNKLVDILMENPSIVIKIESHTDAFGTAAYNKQLSGKRANSTKEYLISQGIDASRIESAIGYGEERLLNDCSDGVECSKEKHRQNRRSEFIIVNM